MINHGYQPPKPKMNVIKALFVKTGTYNDMYVRNYSPNVNGDIINQIDHATEGGRNLTSNALSNVSGSLLRPKPQTTTIAQITGGWGEERLLFIIEVEFETFGNKSRQVLTGYTSHMGMGHVTATGKVPFDENMILYFNTSMNLINTTTVGHNGTQSQTLVRDVSHILRNPLDTGSRTDLNSPSVSMRPEDIFKAMTSNMLGMQGGGSVIDSRLGFVNGVKKSRRSNASAPTYLSKTLQAHKDATDNDDYAEDDSFAISNAASGSVRELSVDHDEFIRHLNGIESVKQGGSITWGDLIYVCPYVDEVKQVVVSNSRAHANKTHMRGSTENWNGANQETVIANIISQAVPALMLEQTITGFRFTANNMGPGGEVNVTPLSAPTFYSTGVNHQLLIQQLLSRIKNETLRDISMGGLVIYDIMVDINVFAESHISISLDGGYATPFTMPSFGDALIAPVVAATDKELSTLAYEVDNIVANFDQQPNVNPSIYVPGQSGSGV